MFIDSNELRYKNMYDKLTKYEKGLKRNINYSFDVLKNQNMIDTIVSIIKVYRKVAYFTTISCVVNELCSTCCSILIKNHNLHEIIGNLLKIREDKIRKLVVEFFFYQDDKTINMKVLTQITYIMSNFNSVTAGETELILSMVYLIFNRIALDQSRFQDTRLCQVFVNAVVLAVEFLIQNNDRNPTSKEETLQKNKLSASLLLYINTHGQMLDVLFINTFLFPINA